MTYLLVIGNIPFPFFIFCLELKSDCVRLFHHPVARLPWKGYRHVFVINCH